MAENHGDWARLLYAESLADIRWAKERAANVVQWALALLAGLRGIGSLTNTPSFGTTSGLLAAGVVVGGGAIAWLWQLHGFARSTRERVEGIWENELPKTLHRYRHERSHDPHHLKHLLMEIAVIVVVLIVAVWPLLPDNAPSEIPMIYENLGMWVTALATAALAFVGIVQIAGNRVEARRRNGRLDATAQYFGVLVARTLGQLLADMEALKSYTNHEGWRLNTSRFSRVLDAVEANIERLATASIERHGGTSHGLSLILGSFQQGAHRVNELAADNWRDPELRMAELALAIDDLAQTKTTIEREYQTWQLGRSRSVERS